MTNENIVGFFPWIGIDYKDQKPKQEESDPKAGPSFGDKIFFIGAQHWCRPSQFGCGIKEEEVKDCLKKKNANCHEWEKNDKICPLRKENTNWCPMFLNTELRKKKCANGLTPLLQCETRISITHHIKCKEITRRQDVFFIVYDFLRDHYSSQMKKIFGLNELPLESDDITTKQREKYWSRIAFMNYVQHYTIPIKNTWLNIKELDYTKEKDKKIFRRYIRDLSYSPDVIVILKEKIIKEKVEENLKGLAKKYYYQASLSKDNLYYVFCTEKSQLYKEKSLRIDEFIDAVIEDKMKSDKVDTLFLACLAKCIQQDMGFSTLKKSIRHILGRDILKDSNNVYKVNTIEKKISEERKRSEKSEIIINGLNEKKEEFFS